MATDESDSCIASRNYHWKLSNFSCTSSETLARRGEPVVEIERRGRG